MLPLFPYTTLFRSDVEVGERVGGRVPALEVRLDLREVLAREVEDRMEGLGLARLLAADGGDEQLARLAEAAEAVEVAIEVVREEGHGVAVIPRLDEGPARVHPDEQALPQPVRGRRLRHGRRREQSTREQREGERAGGAHGAPCLLGCRCINPARTSRVSVTSFRLLNGDRKSTRLNSSHRCI